MRGLNPSAVLYFRKPSMALAKESETFDFDVPGELRFIRNSSIFGKMSTAVRQARDCGPLGNEKPEPDGLWFTLSSGEWIRTTDLRVMSPTSCLCSTPHRLLNDQNFTAPCLIRQAKLSSASDNPIRWVNLFYDPFLRIFRIISIIRGKWVFLACVRTPKTP